MFWDNFSQYRIQKLWEDSVRFHGDACPLLALGVRVCDAVLSKLDVKEPERGRLVCISESSGCCVDAIQIGLHCTAGTEHLQYHRTGNLCFTVCDLTTGRAVRICTKQIIADKIPTMKAADVLSLPEDRLFEYEDPIALPSSAALELRTLTH